MPPRASTMPDSGAATFGGSDHRRPWVLLDTVAYIDDDDFVQNATTATTSTSSGSTVEVSFALGDPPALSRCVVRCTGTTKPAHRLSYARLIRAEEDLLLLCIFFTTRVDYFVYRAGPGKPSLYLLPRPYPPVLDTYSRTVSDEIAIMPCGGDDGKQYLVVIPVMLTPRNLSYVLHIFSSETERWSTKVAQVDWDDEETDYDKVVFHRASKVMVDRDGPLLFWVDLWQGILVCNVLDANPVMRLIQLPAPSPSNMTDDYEMSNAQSCRDVTFRNGALRFVEADYNDDTISSNNGTQVPNYSWTATISKRTVSSEEWSVCFKVESSEISVSDPCFHYLPSEMRGEVANKLNLSKVVTAAPMLGLHHDDFLYMMSKLKPENPTAWVFGVNPKNNKLEVLAQFSAERMFCFEPTYHPCSFSNYIGVTPGTDRDNHQLSTDIVRKEQVHSAFHVMALLLVKNISRQLEEYLTHEMISYNECISILENCLASSHYVNVQELARYSVSVGICKSTSEAVTMYQRALKDIGELLPLQVNQPAHGEAIRGKISVAVEALDNLFQTVPSNMLDQGRELAKLCLDHEPVDAEGVPRKFASQHLVYAMCRAFQNSVRIDEDDCSTGPMPEHIATPIAGTDLDNHQLNNNIMRKNQEPSAFHVMAVMLVKNTLWQLEECLAYEMLSYNECMSIVREGLTASLYVNIQELAEYAISIGICKATLEVDTMYKRALEDIGELLLLQVDQSAHDEAIRDKISLAIEALDSVLQTVPSNMLNNGRALAVHVACEPSDGGGISKNLTSPILGYVC